MLLYRRASNKKKQPRIETLANGTFEDFDAFALECSSKFAALNPSHTVEGRFLVGPPDAPYIVNRDFKSGRAFLWSSMPNQTLAKFLDTHVRHTYFPQASSLVPVGVVPHHHIVKREAIQKMASQQVGM